MTSCAYRDPQDLPPGLRFLAGGGEATRLILARDWSDHPLGPPQHWPVGLKSALSTVLNSPESMILCWDADALFFFFNETYFPLLGPRLPWAMGTRFDIVWADGWAQAKPIVDEAFAGRSQRFNDLPWKLDTDRGQANTWFTFSYSRVLDAEGEIAGLFIFTNETTQRVLADAALRDSAERLRLVVEGARDYAIVATDPAGVITQWSSGAEAVLGWTADEAVGQPLALIYTAEDRAAAVPDDELARVLQTGGVLDERWHCRKDGTRVFLNGSVNPLPATADGAPRGFIKVARDETERWKAQRALQDRNASLEREVAERTVDRNLAWQLSQELLAVVLPDGTLESVNPLWTQLLGWTEAELLGLPFRRLVHADDLARTEQVFAGIFESPLAEAYENRFRHKDGHHLWFAWTAVFKGGKIYASGRHTTLERQQADWLAQAQKMDAVGQLTGGLAHDFNNLLAGISGSLDLMSQRIRQGRVNELDKYIVAARGAAKRAASLTHRLLAFSRQQTLAPRPISVNDLMSGMLELVQRTVGPAITVEAVGMAGLWATLVDPPQLENALLNLCINARDAMPNGGRITIETANRWIDASGARQRDMPEGQYVSLCVSDTGIGMSPEVLAKAFDPFFTTKPIGQGTGLGLSMIYGFAKQSGGQVRIHSKPGEGSTVCIYLPRHLGEAERLELSAELPEAQAPAGSGETVLVVDDEPSLRMLLADVLQEQGYQVIEAADSAAGLRILQSDTRLDLLISDVGLPGGMNGRQMADAGRLHRPELQVLFVSGYAENALLHHGQLAPGMSVMTKPFEIERLVARVRELIGR